jgi:ligand-binding SRPBCC domain-containing protein
MVSIEWDAVEKCYELKAAVTLEYSREQLFEFFSDAFQLEQITPAWLNFQILTPPPIQIQEGTLIDYSIRLHGIPVRWRTEIASWQPPFAFVDRQLKGPYRLWEHLHTFETVDEGTLAVDRVRYRVFGGGLIHRLFVKNDLKTIFEFRQRRMLELFPPKSCKLTEQGVAV